MAEILPTRRKTLLNQYNGADALARACLFVCLFVCLFGVLHPTREVFTHMGTSPLPVK